jgi:cephalosporin-C deacetylase-like acetyl esterase
VENGKVDEQRLCITGRSAGGYTTLASLAFRDTFKAGASLYGVSSIFSGSIVCWAAIAYRQTFTRYSMGSAAPIFVFS